MHFLRYTRPHIVKQRHHPLEQQVLLCSLKPGDAEPTLSDDLLIFCVSLLLRLADVCSVRLTKMPANAVFV